MLTASTTLDRTEEYRYLRSLVSEHLVDYPLQVPPFFRQKYWIERLIAGVLLLLALPIIGLLVVLVRLTSRGPAIYRQQRVGERGRTFTMFKIRTMRLDAEAVSGPKWSTQSDPRVTRVGRFLRAVHLDELPQLINVVLGEMSIIGPRPERPDFVIMLLGQVDGYVGRLTVKPGITGLAQIYLPPDETIDCVRKKIVFDQKYISEASTVLELQIWFCTILRMMGVRGGRGPRWFGLDRRLMAAEGIPKRPEKPVMVEQTAVSRNGTQKSGRRKEVAHAVDGNGSAKPFLTVTKLNGSEVDSRIPRNPK